MKRAAFLDRDGVLIPDDGLLRDPARVQLLDGVAEALSSLERGGFELIVVSNQPVIARGMATEDDVHAVNNAIARAVSSAGGPQLNVFYFCPHHPNAYVEQYRLDCDCRKPRPGLFRRAASERGVDLHASYMVGDRITDVVAGAMAGCKTVLVETGRHTDPLIETTMVIDPLITPDFVCAGLPAAAEWILAQ